MVDFAEDRNDLPALTDEQFASGFGAACDDSGNFLDMTLRNINGVLNVITKRIVTVANSVSGFTALIQANTASASTNKDDIDNLRATLLTQASSLVVKGTIVLWGGTTVPSGWALCDGQTAGVPDLRGRLPLGFDATHPLNSTGGGFTANTGSAGSHSHGGNTGGTSLTTSQMPLHDHGVTQSPHSHPVSQNPHTHTDTKGPSGGWDGLSARTSAQVSHTGTETAQGFVTDPASADITVASANANISINETGGGNAHNHSIPDEGGHSHTVNIIPPYYAIGFIQKL